MPDIKFTLTEDLIADRRALLAMLVHRWPGGGFVCPRLPERDGGHPGGTRYQDRSWEGWWFEEREDAERAVLWAARWMVEKGGRAR